MMPVILPCNSLINSILKFSWLAPLLIVSVNISVWMIWLEWLWWREAENLGVELLSYYVLCVNKINEKLLKVIKHDSMFLLSVSSFFRTISCSRFLTISLASRSLFQFFLKSLPLYFLHRSIINFTKFSVLIKPMKVVKLVSMFLLSTLRMSNMIAKQICVSIRSHNVQCLQVN